VRGDGGTEHPKISLSFLYLSMFIVFFVWMVFGSVLWLSTAWQWYPFFLFFPRIHFYLCRRAPLGRLLVRFLVVSRFELKKKRDSVRLQRGDRKAEGRDGTDSGRWLISLWRLQRRNDVMEENGKSCGQRGSSSWREFCLSVFFSGLKLFLSFFSFCDHSQQRRLLSVCCVFVLFSSNLFVFSSPPVVSLSTVKETEGTFSFVWDRSRMDVCLFGLTACMAVWPDPAANSVPTLLIEPSFFSCSFLLPAFLACLFLAEWGGRGVKEKRGAVDSFLFFPCTHSCRNAVVWMQNKECCIVSHSCNRGLWGTQRAKRKEGNHWPPPPFPPRGNLRKEKKRGHTETRIPVRSHRKMASQEVTHTLTENERERQREFARRAHLSLAWVILLSLLDVSCSGHRWN